MATRKTRDGLEPRHRKHCRKPRDDGKCCGASFRAQVFDARTGKPIKRTFPTRTAAKLWRADAQKALRDGDRASLVPSKRTIGQALDDVIAGMEGGTALDRSGRRYRPATIRSYKSASENYLKPVLGHLRLGEATR